MKINKMRKFIDNNTTNKIMVCVCVGGGGGGAGDPNKKSQLLFPTEKYFLSLTSIWYAHR